MLCNSGCKFYSVPYKMLGKPVCCWVRPAGNVICFSGDSSIKAASTMPAKEYYTTMAGYLHSTASLYTDGQSFHPGGGGYYSNTLACKPIIYKPNNPGFKVQGGVDSSARIERLKYLTIRKNNATFTSAPKYSPYPINLNKYTEVPCNVLVKAVNDRGVQTCA